MDLASALAGVAHCGLHAEAAAAERDEVLGWLAPRGSVLTGPAGRDAPRSTTRKSSAATESGGGSSGPPGAATSGATSPP